MGLLNSARYFRSVVREKAKDLTRSPLWRSTRKKHLELHPACAACGSTKKLQVHHKMPFHIDPTLELAEHNLITLCMGPNECHLNIGHGDDYKCYNPNVEKDAAACLATPSGRKAIVENARRTRLGSRD